MQMCRLQGRANCIWESGVCSGTESLQGFGHGELGLQCNTSGLGLDPRHGATHPRLTKAWRLDAEGV